MIIKIKNKEVSLDVKKVSGFKKFSGLMFSRREKASPLLFDFRKPTKTTFHSLFCFFPFLIIWLDKDNNVLEKRICKPFLPTIKPRNSFVKVVEIPLNKKYSKLVKEIIDEERFKY